MKIAIPTRDRMIDGHYGHCKEYTIYTIDKNEVIETETVPSPQGCGCKSNIAQELKAKGVELMLAGNMGEGALRVLSNNGIKVIRGCSGDSETVIEKYIKGDLSDSGVGCGHHDHTHQCSH